MKFFRRSLLVCCAFCMIHVRAASKKRRYDESFIGKYAAIVANNLLAEDMTNGDAKIFLQVSEQLTPNDENLLLAKALLKRGHAPKAIETKMTKDILLKTMVSRGLYWYKKNPQFYEKAPTRALFYLRIADKLMTEPDSQVIVALARLEKNAATASETGQTTKPATNKCPVYPSYGRSDTPRLEKKKPVKKVYLTKAMALSIETYQWVRDNLNWGGNKPIKIGGVQYERGLGVHAESEITFPLKKKYDQFHVVPGPDDSRAGKLEMKILVDGKEVFTTGLTSSKEKGKRKAVKISVKDADTLTLIVNTGDGDRGGDHASWGDAYLTH